MTTRSELAAALLETPPSDVEVVVLVDGRPYGITALHVLSVTAVMHGLFLKPGTLVLECVSTS